MIRLTRSEPARKMHRFYTLQLAPTRFGEWALVAEWGRIGLSGKVMHAVFQTEPEAQKALNKRLTIKQNQARLPALTCFIFRFVRRPLNQRVSKPAANIRS